MTRARLDLSDFDDAPASKNTTVLREISDEAGFPSRPATPAKAYGVPNSGPAQPTSAPAPFHRPARPTAGRSIAINTRLEPDVATMIYELRDADPSRKRAIADVIGEAVRLLYDQEFAGPK